MKRIFVLIVICAGIAATAGAWFGGASGDPIVIIAASEWVAITNTTPNLSTDAFDLGDADAVIGEKYHGLDTPFDDGGSVALRVWFMPYPDPVTTLYDEMLIQYHEGSGPTIDSDWTTIASIDDGLEARLGTGGLHFGARWIPPCVTNAVPYNTNYLIRVYAKLTDATESSDLAETGIGADGNSGTWDDNEVLLINVTTNRKPGYVY